AACSAPPLRAHRNLLDPEYRQLLPMPMLAAIVLAPLFLEHDDLAAPRLLHDLRTHGSARDHRSSDFGVLAPQRQHLGEADFRPDIAGNPLDRELVAYTNAVLLPAGFYDRKHGPIGITLNIGAPRACQRREPRKWCTQILEGLRSNRAKLPLLEEFRGKRRLRARRAIPVG